MCMKLLDGNLNPDSCPSISQELILIKLPSHQGVQWSCVVVIVIITIIIYERERERERERGFQFHHFARVWLHTIKWEIIVYS